MMRLVFDDLSAISSSVCHQNVSWLACARARLRGAKAILAACAALLILPSCGGGDGVPAQRLVVYSPHGPEVLGDWAKRFEAAYPGVDAQMFDMGSQDVYNRVAAERNRPACDVWWGAPSTMFAQAAEAGLLEAYTPSWADRVDAAYRDAEGCWFGTYSSPLAIVYNDRRYKPDEVPQTWDELLKPEWAGKISLRMPLASGTMRTFICAMIARAPSEDAGIEWLRKLHAATREYPQSPQLLYDHIKRNEEVITVWLMPDVALQRDRNGYPFAWVIPPDTPVLIEGIAIVRGAPHGELARKFYEFVTTPEALAQQAQAYSKIPARNDLDPATLPEWMAQQEIGVMEIDWGRFAGKEQAWVSRWEKEVYNAP